ncbi:hypothetical protein Z045_24795 [Rhodococcus pyridinivorans KG-16]|uniref:Uncharacterized protein n=1 Tax=Rhodococcus pyridinivorans KG-16 TaxID=1441730 RepID=A0A0V9UDN8_9NOCA|nr:hypothetical protein [Rhodococcus pyridinivorans]KSZ56150.1 hypothetical protein Z045_24795 [Rhodococcus pyridinivorans KG-16]
MTLRKITGSAAAAIAAAALATGLAVAFAPTAVATPVYITYPDSVACANAAKSLREAYPGLYVRCSMKAGTVYAHELIYDPADIPKLQQNPRPARPSTGSFGSS